MRIGRNKSNEEKLEIELAAKRSRKDLFTSTTERSLTTSGSIGLALLTVFLLVSLASMQIGSDSRKGNDPNSKMPWWI